jgi:hypothetical protein
VDIDQRTDALVADAMLRERAGQDGAKVSST